MNKVALGLLMSLGCVPLFAQSRLASNLVTHSEVTIDRPAPAVWRVLVDPNRWKRGAKIWHHAGPTGEVGEVFAAGDPANRSTIFYFVEDIELVPNERRTIKLYSPTATLIGFATWWLREEKGRTTVGYDVFSESMVDPAQGKSASEIREAERSDRATNKKRFDDELAELKRLVEGSGS